MKRLVSILICVAICLSMLSVGVSADAASLAERVLLLVRPRIPDTSIYEDFTSSVSVENGGNTLYHFNWSSSEGGEYKGMYVSALEDGIITSFGISDSSQQGGADASSGFDRISVNEAKERTKKLIDKLNPELAGKLELSADSKVEQFEAKNHTFSITHTESGIPVYGDKGRVTVDIDAQRIIGFNMTYNDKLSYPSPVNIKDLATAKILFAQEIGLDLYYRVWQDSEKKSVKIFPVYSPKSDNMYINATSGKAERIVPFSDSLFAKDEASPMAPGGGNSLGLTPAELKEIQNLKKLLSRKDAEALVRRIKVLNINDNCTLEEFSTRKLSVIEELYGHSLVFVEKGEARDSYIFVDINAETGEVLSFSNFGRSNDKVEASDEEMAAICDDVFKTLAADKYSEYRLRQSDGDKDFAVYDRFTNGIRVDGNTASIELAPDNSLASYRISYTNADFPMYSDIISGNEASSRLFDNVKYSLMYIPQKTNPELKTPDIAVLVYALEENNVNIDPYTGKRINSDGSEYIAENPTGEYIDISGHYAEDKIKALRRFGIGFDGEQFIPDGDCLQKDFIILLTAAFGTKNSILISDSTRTDDYYEVAKRTGIITEAEISPEAKVTRLQAAKFICRALEIDKYAQMEEIFNCPFNDVTQDKGYVTMLWGMGIVNGTAANKFSPNDSLTRGQTAIMIYNAMNNR